jgi:methylenetetrahydrofolate--tRNA-(uracil-5-)-methyltransferase
MEQPLSVPPRTTAMGALAFYVSHANPSHYDPANITFGIMAPIDDRGLPRARAADGRRLTRKESRKLALSRRALADLEAWTQDLPSVLRPSLPSDHRQPQPVGR